MGDSVAFTVHMPKSVFDNLEARAKRAGRDIDDLACEALVRHLEHVAAVEEAIAEADAEGGGPWIAHADVVRWLESWGTEHELPPPT
jgi:predicted transcriptional regulator